MYHNTHRKARKRLKRCNPPFWNDELKELSSNLCTKENSFINARGHDRNIIRQEFEIAQNLFDRVYRRLERKYDKDKIIEIENISTSDPKQFWKAIHKLGPKSKKNIPVEVYNEDGNIETDMNKVLNKWSSEYETLYTFLPESGTVDDQFFNEHKQNLINIEQNGHILEGLNHRISLEKVDKVISNSMNNKSVRMDNLPNEIFKNKRSNTL